MVFLLNPDARIEGEAIAILADRMERDPRAAVAGCRITRPSGEPAISAGFRYPSLGAEFVNAVSFGPLSRLFPNLGITFPEGDDDARVDWVSGAAFMARLDALREVDNFDPAYFLYFEEIDLMLRLRRKGWDILFVPGAEVRHVSGAATGVTGDRPGRRPLPGYWYESWRLYFSRNHGRAYAVGCGLARMAGSGLNRAIGGLRRRDSTLPEAFFRDFARHAVRPLLTRSR